MRVVVNQYKINLVLSPLRYAAALELLKRMYSWYALNGASEKPVNLFPRTSVNCRPRSVMRDARLTGVGLVRVAM